MWVSIVGGYKSGFIPCRLLLSDLSRRDQTHTMGPYPANIGMHVVETKSRRIAHKNLYTYVSERNDDLRLLFL